MLPKKTRFRQLLSLLLALLHLFCVCSGSNCEETGGDDFLSMSISERADIVALKGLMTMQPLSYSACLHNFFP